jgi:hypothetical protein
MDEGKIGHHYAKRLGAIDAPKNLSSNPLQFIGDLVSQGEYECGVNTLKWNVQPLVIVERNELRLRGLGFETHDDVLCEGVLSPDFQHSKQLGEMALSKFGIDGEPELSALLCGGNNSTLRSECGPLGRDHVVSFL